MIDITTALAAFTVCLAGVMSPGPSFVAVTHRAITASRAEAMAFVAGVVAINALWATAALFGLGSLFALFPWMFWTAKILGGAYLVWFGVQLLRRSGRALPGQTDGARRRSLAKACCEGVVANLSNPKSMIFYASVFSAAAPAGATTETLLDLVGIVAAVSAFWYGGVAVALSSARAVGVYRRWKKGVERTCGVFLIAFGLRQALAR